MLVNVQPPAGFFTDITDLDAGAKWVRGDKVRFHLGRLRKIGGWQKINPDEPFEGKCRYIHSYQDLDLVQNIWIGTHTNVYLLREDLTDITPLDEELTIIDPYTTEGIGTSTMRITDVGHNRVEGDKIIILDGPTTVDGVTIAAGEYTVLSVVSSSIYRIQGTGAAITGTTNGGGSIDFEYLLTQGIEYASFSGGWGSGAWGTGTWGTHRVGSTFTSPSIWSADSWGEDVIAVRRRGSRVFYYDNSVGLTNNRMTPIERVNASTLVGTGTYPRANAVSVSPERMMVLFGAEESFGGSMDPLLIRWSDRENYAVLDDLDTNTAGSFRLQVGNEILAHEKTKNGYIILTETGATFMQFVGYPFIWGFTPLGNNCGVAGPNASAEHNGVVYWMGTNHQFYRFDGRIEVIPNSVQQYVQRDLNTAQSHLISCGINAQWKEVIWLYPSQTNAFTTSYVIHNWENGSWYCGTLERTFWHDHSTFRNPIAADNDGYLYFHEVGKDDDTSAIYAWAETGEFQLADGDRLVFLDRIIPDADQTGDIDYTIKAKRYPMSSEEFVKGPYTATSSTEKIDLRARGRQWAIKVESNAVGADFQLGKIRANIQPDGGR